MLKTGWTPGAAQGVLRLVPQGRARIKGGASFGGFLANIKRRRRRDAERGGEGRAEGGPRSAAADACRRRRRQAAAVRQEVDASTSWRPVVEKGLTKRDFDRGRTLFGGGQLLRLPPLRQRGRRARPGPDRRRRPVQRARPARVDRRAEQGDQRPVRGGHRSSRPTAGRSPGRIVNLHGDTIQINTDMLDPRPGDRRRPQASRVDRDVEGLDDAEGLLDTLKEDEVLDLMAYLLSRGDRTSAMFKK